MNLKAIIITAFWKQNGWHQHGVIVHTLRVTYEVVRAGDYKMIPAAILHDIGKPFTAYQKPQDIIRKEHSFTDHEEKSYQIIKNIPFISDYTKNLVRYHYLIRDIHLGKIKNNGRAELKQPIWDSLTPEFQEDLKRFLTYDDLGKGSTEKSRNANNNNDNYGARGADIADI